MSGKTDALIYGGAALVGVVGVYLVYRAVKSGSAGRIASDLAGGAVQSVGSAVGVPTTDTDKCAAALAADDLWAVSKYCPAGTFLAASGQRLRGNNLDGTPKVAAAPDQSDAETARLARQAVAPMPDQTDAETARLARQAVIGYTDSNSTVVDNPDAPYTTTDNDTPTYAWGA